MHNPAHMKDDVAINVRVRPEIAERIEKFRVKLAKKTPGAKISTSNAVRVLIEKSLASEVR